MTDQLEKTNKGIYLTEAQCARHAARLENTLAQKMENVEVNIIFSSDGNMNLRIDTSRTPIYWSLERIFSSISEELEPFWTITRTELSAVGCITKWSKALFYIDGNIRKIAFDSIPDKNLKRAYEAGFSKAREDKNANCANTFEEWLKIFKAFRAEGFAALQGRTE